MEESVRQRIIEVIETKGFNITSYSRGDKSIQRRLNRQLREGSAVTFETISSIIESFNDVSSEWLITGRGEMIKRDSGSDGLYKNEVAELRERIKYLEGQNDLLREQAGMSKPLENVKGKSA